MANQEHLEILKQGVEVWNKWRREHLKITPNINGAVLTYTDLSRVNLFGTDLSRAILIHTNFFGANLFGANLLRAELNGTELSYADLSLAVLTGANLSSANLRGANLTGTNLRGANLSSANLTGANLTKTILSNAILTDTDFTDAKLGYATFVDNDLSEVKGLESITHNAPSSIGLDTLYKSAGKIPEVFLQGCGVPDDFITFIPSHFGIQQAIQFYSCFISYSTKDEEFARRLYSRMRDEKLRVWFAPEDMKGGENLYEQVERAIQLYDRLLLVLSENSMQSKWVITEIQRARETEVKENRRKLFPITIVDFDKVKAWSCFDTDNGMDLAKEVRRYFIPDFSNWKDYNNFETAFSKLLRDLKAEEKKA